MTTARIICIGNRYVDGDAAGYRVFDRLRGRCPPDVDLVDGGIQGLNLLRLFEGTGRVVIVDSIDVDLAAGRDVVVLDGARVAALADDEGYGHAAGVPFLLRVLPAACDPVPTVILVGIGDNNEAALDRAASLALTLALDGEARREDWADGAAGHV